MHLASPVSRTAPLNLRAARMLQLTTKTGGDIFVPYLARMLLLECLQHSVQNISQKFVRRAGLHFLVYNPFFYPMLAIYFRLQRNS
jgi:hypothetical protein